MSAHRKPKRVPLTVRLLQRAERNLELPNSEQFMRDGELCREAAERLMKLEGFFAGLETMAWDAREEVE